MKISFFGNDQWALGWDNEHWEWVWDWALGLEWELGQWAGTMGIGMGMGGNGTMGSVPFPTLWAASIRIPIQMPIDHFQKRKFSLLRKCKTKTSFFGFCI